MRSCRTLLIYCISFIGFFLAGIAIDLACGGEIDPYDYYVSFFHNNVQTDKQYKPFYFTSWQFVYDDKEPQSEADINAGEWSAYLGKEVATADVIKAMYNLSPRTDSVLLAGYLKNGERLPDSLAGNTFFKSIKHNAGALKYYRFVKGIEPMVNVGTDSWNPKPLDTVALYTAGGAAWKNALNEHDKFIQLRYFYQAQRLLHYSNNHREALGLYNKYIDAISSQSHVKGWALSLKAGELRRLKDTVQAAYLFTKIFAQYPERRLQAYRNYKYIHVTAPQVLPLAVNNNERAVIYAIDGFGNPEPTMEPLQKVYQYDPASPMVGVLLTREVNKLEEGYITGKLLKANPLIGTNYYYASTDIKKSIDTIGHIKRLIAFCKTLVNEKKYPDYNLGNLAGAYLNWIQGDNANGFAYLRAMNSEKLTPAMNDQKQIIQLLLAAQNMQKINEVNEEQLLPALKWLDVKNKAELAKNKKAQQGKYSFSFQDNNQFANSTRNFYEQVLASAYLKQGDTLKAALTLLKNPELESLRSFWTSNLHSGQIIRLIRWRKQPPTSAYMIYLTDKLNGIDVNYFYELLGTAYLREHQYAKAVTAFKQVLPAYLNKYPEDYYKGDPFIDRINDYPKILHYGKTKGLNKLQFAEVMNTLEQKIKTDKANAPSYYYRLATGLYNTSHYGNASYLISYNWSADDFGRKSIYSYDVDYLRTQNAEKYYLLARSLSVNEEFKAKCTIMAAKCRQKQAIEPEYSIANYDDLYKLYQQQLHSNKYFDELRDNYKKTAIYKKAVAECSYLKDFLMVSR